MAPIPSQPIRFSSKSPMDSKDLAMPTSKKTNALLCGSIKSIHLSAVATIGAAVVIIAFPATAQTPAPASKTKAETTTAVKVEPLSGAELWALNCNRCHMARSPGEFTAAQWQTIIRHMRVRANLPAAQARELQKFLQAGAGK
jgi:cytochrome c5